MPWNPLKTHDPKLGQERLKNKLQGQGLVIKKGNPRDLEKLATEYSANPSIWKRMLHSSFISPMRRSVQSEGSARAAVARGLQQGFTIAIGKIPVPVLNSILSNAFDRACDKIREKIHHDKIGEYAIASEERVKFELKDIAKEVEMLDGYRWKISHAVEQYNKAIKLVEVLESKPCDRWVHVMVKLKYLKKRIDKLRSSLEMIKATCDETEKWLSNVEADYKKTSEQIEPKMKDDIEKLKIFAGVHETCTEEFCMYKDKKWTESKTVPTNEASLFLIRGVSGALDLVSTNADDYF
jgi:hypothetical protein